MQIKKLVTVTRDNLSPSQQAVQSTHAAINFCFKQRNKASPWFEESQYLVMLAVKNTEELKLLIDKCELFNVAYEAFYEPDLNNELTAVCLEPGLITQKLVKKIPLMFKTK